MASNLQPAITAILQNNYVGLVIAIAVGYDYVLTFPNEIEYIWKKRWTWVSTLFVLIRYFGLYFVMSTALGTFKLCIGKIIELIQLDKSGNFFPTYLYEGNVLGLFCEWAALAFFGAADLVMILRLWALYDRSRLILAALLALFTIQVITYLICDIVISTRNNPEMIIVQVLDYSFCEMQYDSPILALTSEISQLVLGAFMCLLVAFRFVRESLQMYKATKQVQLSRYVNVLVREGIIYFLAILAYTLLTLLFYTGKIPTNGWWLLLALPEYVPVSTLVPRFILGLRELYARDLQGRCGSNIDTAFGLTSGHDQGIVGSMVMFADDEQIRGPEWGEDTAMEEREVHRDIVDGDA